MTKEEAIRKIELRSNVCLSLANKYYDANNSCWQHYQGKVDGYSNAIEIIKEIKE